MGNAHIVELYKNTFNIIYNHEQKSNSSSKKEKGRLSDFIPFYSEEKSFYDDIEECYRRWLKSKKISCDDAIMDKLSEAYSVLFDEESRRVFDWYVKFRITFTIIRDVEIAEGLFPYPTPNSKYYLAKLAAKSIKKQDDLFNVKGYTLDSELYLISETWICETYLLEGKCEPSSGDIVIDAGAYKGETSIWFADKVGSTGKVYAFEVLQPHIDTINKSIEINKLQNILCVINKGLWDKNSCIYAVKGGDATRCAQKDGEAQIDVITLDSFVEEGNIDRIDLIKMDIEGAELLALKGALNTIKKFKPKLAICLYHKYLDIIDIPLWLKSIVPEYKIYLAQKTPVAHSIVLYASI